VLSGNTSSKVADVPANSPVANIVEGEMGLDAGSDDQDVDA